MFQEAYKSGEEQPDRMTGAEGTKESMRLENSKNIDISVIMPVYNSGNYLEQSLSSLTGQTLENIEIICINDGSTDSSAEILGRFSKKDKRIKVLSRNHIGAGGARNAGLFEASGEYVIFLD